MVTQSQHAIKGGDIKNALELGVLCNSPSSGRMPGPHECASCRGKY